MIKSLTREQREFINESYKINSGIVVQQLFEMKFNEKVSIASILTYGDNKKLHMRWEKWEVDYVTKNCDYTSQASVKKASIFLNRTIRSTYAKARAQHFRNKSIDHGLLMLNRKQSLEKASQMLEIGEKYRIKSNLPQAISELSKWTECEVVEEFENFFLLKIGDYNESVSKINLLIGNVEVKGCRHESE